MRYGTLNSTTKSETWVELVRAERGLRKGEKGEKKAIKGLIRAEDGRKRHGRVILTRGFGPAV